MVVDVVDVVDVLVDVVVVVVVVGIAVVVVEVVEDVLVVVVAGHTSQSPKLLSVALELPLPVICTVPSNAQKYTSLNDP